MTYQSSSRRFPRKQPMSTAGTKKDLAQDKQIQNLKKKVKAIEYKEEVKFVDKSTNDGAILETGLQLALGSIPAGIIQGDSTNERDGNEILTTSLLMRLALYTDIDKLVPSFVRIVVYWDSQANGAVNVTSGTNNSLMLASGTVPGHLDYRNQNTIERFTILWDKTVVLNPQLHLTEAAGSVTANQPVSTYITKRFKLGRKIKFTGNAGTIADIAGNNLCVVLISDSDTNPPTVDSNLRMYFKDL